jgi:cytidyltransferase-like protein
MPKVFVSGCFDVLHSGHVAFLEEAASYGDVYVSIGSDETVRILKNRKTMYNEQERKYMLEAIRYVTKVYIGPDTGKILDFAPLLDEVKPDIFFVNGDGTSDEKRAFVEAKGIRYVTSTRIPHGNLPQRSTTSIRESLGK